MDAKISQKSARYLIYTLLAEIIIHFKRYFYTSTNSILSLLDHAIWGSYSDNLLKVQL